jgi:hypothetical protein
VIGGSLQAAEARWSVNKGIEQCNCAKSDSGRDACRSGRYWLWRQRPPLRFRNVPSSLRIAQNGRQVLASRDAGNLGMKGLWSPGNRSFDLMVVNLPWGLRHYGTTDHSPWPLARLSANCWRIYLTSEMKHRSRLSSQDPIAKTEAGMRGGTSETLSNPSSGDDRCQVCSRS